jgi:ABC-type branched-subunit amino acid transport system substrate-binding protein
VKSRILLISVAVVLAVSLGLAGCTTPAPTGPQPSDKIVIGMSRSEHGSLQIVHLSAFLPVYTAYVAYINAGGGITVGGQKFLIDVLDLDDNSSEAALVGNTATLISDVDKGTVHTIFGPTCTHYIDVMAPLTNTAKKVLMTAEGGGTFLIEDPGPPPLPGPITAYSYVFITLSFSDWYQLPVLACALDEAHYDYCGQHNATAWIVYQDDSHGLEYRYAAAKYFPARNINILGSTPVLYDPGYPFGTNLATIAAANPDILCLFCYPNEIYGYVGTAMATHTNFKAVVGGPGACFGIFATNLGAANVEGITTFAIGNNKTSNAGNPIPDATMTMETLFNTIISGGDWSGQDAWGHPLYWAALEIWQHAIEAVGYVQDGGFMVDQDALKDELHKYKDETSGVNTVLGKTWYSFFGTGGAGGGILDYLCHTGEIGQWQNGYIEVVAPSQCLNPDATANVTLSTYLPRYRATVVGGLVYPKATW